MYQPMQNTCMTVTPNVATPGGNTLYGFTSQTTIAPGTEDVGTIWAVSVETGKTLWKHEQRTGMLSVVATAGGLVFIGASNDRRFRAFDSRTGAELWVTEVPLSAHAVPITYAAAGVDVEAGDRAVELMKASVRRATRPEVLGGLGGFAGMFDASALTGAVSARKPGDEVEITIVRGGDTRTLEVTLGARPS